MKKVTQKITERDIFIYREIYYETVKPMIVSHKTAIEINFALKYMCEEFGITPQRYKVLSNVDFMQRMAKFNNKRIIVQSGTNSIVPYEHKNSLENIPEMKCPRRTEDRN